MAESKPTSGKTFLKAICLATTVLSGIFTILGLATQIAQVVKPDSIVRPTKFELTDLQPGQNFVATLKHSNEPLALFLRSKFSPSFQAQLQAYSTATKAETALQEQSLDEINRIVEGDNIYETARFAGVDLSERTFRLCKQNPTGRRAVLLNRWLIEDSFPDELKASAGGFWDVVDRLNSAFGGWYTALFFALTSLGALLSTFFADFQATEERIENLVAANARQVEVAQVLGSISRLYPPLAVDQHLQAFLREHSGAAGTDSNGNLTISHSNSHHHVTVHSEVLYYSLLCSLLNAFQGKITEIWRSHVFLPASPSFLFLSEIISLTKPIPTQHRFYLFRNNVLDYNRDFLRGSQITENHIPLLGSFAKASRILFSDSGAHFGYLEAAGAKTIWHDRQPRFAFEGQFRDSCERFMCRLQTNTYLCGHVKRDPDTLKFLQASIVLGEDATTKDFFAKLIAPPGNNPWQTADRWGDYPIEVALVSGEEMEANAQDGVVLWAVDDYRIRGDGGGWLQVGDPRNIAWLKSVAAALRETSINRLFLVPPAVVADPGELVQLFQTMALQFHFLSRTKKDGGRYGEVRLLLQQDGLFELESYGQWKAARVWPDYSLFVQSVADGDRIIGGVALQPEARYVRPEDHDWLLYLRELWTRAAAFPICFDSYAQVIYANRDAIVEKLATRSELLGEGGKPALEKMLQNWLDALYKPQQSHETPTA